MTKQELLKIYQQTDIKDSKAAAKREKAFLQLQKIGQIDSSLEYSDEAFADYDLANFANLPSQEVANTFLTNIFNRLARIDYKLMLGERDDLFSRGLRNPESSGDTTEIIYDQLTDTLAYNRNIFVPTEMNGGELLFSQRIRLSTIVGETNPDKRTLRIVYPALEIPQALMPSMTSGLASGFPEPFFNILKRSWEKWRFERFRKLVSMAGGTPDKDEWFNPEVKWTKNEKQFIKINTPITDSKSLISFLEQVYDTAATLEGEYSKDYNPAGIEQIAAMNEMSIYFDKSLKAFWKTTPQTLFNSKELDFKQNFKSVDFYKMLPSTVDPKITNIKAVMFVDLPDRHPFTHTPFTQNIYRGIQGYEPNVGVGIYDHFWLASGINRSVNILIFYEEGEAGK